MKRHTTAGVYEDNDFVDVSYETIPLKLGAQLNHSMKERFPMARPLEDLSDGPVGHRLSIPFVMSCRNSTGVSRPTQSILLRKSTASASFRRIKITIMAKDI